MRSQRRLYRDQGGVSLQPNTFIGGVANFINTPAALAQRFSINESDIINFTIVGNDIECRVNIDINSVDFSAYNNYTVENTLTYYIDLENHVKSHFILFEQTNLVGKIELNGLLYLYAHAFRETNLKIGIFPNLLELRNSGSSNTHFYKAYDAEVIYIPKCVVFGRNTNGVVQPSVDNDCFRYLKMGCKIYVHPSMETINNGGLEEDLAYARDFRGAVIRYVLNSTAPNAVTNLSIGTKYTTSLQLNFTPPSSVNAIDFYECYANGVKKNNISASGGYITGLNPDTPYTITVKTVDIYYNKSDEFSNSVSETTNQQTTVPTRGMVSYYKNDDVSATLDDAFGADHLTVNGLTLNSMGLVNTCAEATSPTNRAYTTAAVPITGNFSINLWVYRTGTQPDGNNVLADQGGYTPNAGFGIWMNGLGNIAWRINKNYNNYSTAANIPISIWTMVTLTFDGSNINVHINNELKISAPITTPPLSSGERRLFNRRNYDEALKGKLDEVSFHNVKLNSDEISEYFNNGNGTTL